VNKKALAELGDQWLPTGYDYLSTGSCLHSPSEHHHLSRLISLIRSVLSVRYSRTKVHQMPNQVSTGVNFGRFLYFLRDTRLPSPPSFLSSSQHPIQSHCHQTLSSSFQISTQASKLAYQPLVKSFPQRHPQSSPFIKHPAESKLQALLQPHLIIQHVCC